MEMDAVGFCNIVLCIHASIPFHEYSVWKLNHFSLREFNTRRNANEHHVYSIQCEFGKFIQMMEIAAQQNKAEKQQKKKEKWKRTSAVEHNCRIMWIICPQRSAYELWNVVKMSTARWRWWRGDTLWVLAFVAFAHTKWSHPVKNASELFVYNFLLFSSISDKCFCFYTCDLCLVRLRRARHFEFVFSSFPSNFDWSTDTLQSTQCHCDTTFAKFSEMFVSRLIRY